MGPEELTIFKVIERGLLSRVIFAKDKYGDVWKRTEGFGDSGWERIGQST